MPSVYGGATFVNFLLKSPRQGGRLARLGLVLLVIIQGFSFSLGVLAALDE